jgi:hypothetical protein
MFSAHERAGPDCRTATDFQLCALSHSSEIRTAVLPRAPGIPVKPARAEGQPMAFALAARGAAEHGGRPIGQSHRRGGVAQRSKTFWRRRLLQERGA